MRTLCCCIFVLSLFLFCFFFHLCFYGRDIRARLAFARPAARKALLEAPFPRLGFSPVFHTKRISRFVRNREVLAFSGHDATGLTRPYRDLLLAKNVYSISKIPRLAQGGILKNFYRLATSSLATLKVTFGYPLDDWRHSVRDSVRQAVR